MESTKVRKYIEKGKDILNVDVNKLMDPKEVHMVMANVIEVAKMLQKEDHHYEDSVRRT